MCVARLVLLGCPVRPGSVVSQHPVLRLAPTRTDSQPRPLPRLQYDVPPSVLRSASMLRQGSGMPKRPAIARQGSRPGDWTGCRCRRRHVSACSGCTKGLQRPVTLLPLPPLSSFRLQ